MLCSASLLTVLFGCGGNGPSSAGRDDATDPGLPQAPPLETVQLKLRLNAGDRFPVRKVVEQEIVKSFPGPADREPESSRSKLEMLLALTVEDVGADGTRCAVRYDRIRYSRNGGGRQFDYDSAEPPIAIPLELAAYHGMIGRGFSFWIDADNRIARVAGFAEFLEAVLSNVPPESRDEVLLGVENGASEDSVAGFLEGTIGLFPQSAPKGAGDTWRCTRRIARPVPMHIETLCTLRELTDELAVIDLRGEVTSQVSTGVRTVAHEPTHMVVENGTTLGECTLFRESGLPKQSRIVQEFDLAFTMLGKPPVNEHRRVTTTIESYPALHSRR